jgi:hypothetical protein
MHHLLTSEQASLDGVVCGLQFQSFAAVTFNELGSADLRAPFFKVLTVLTTKFPHSFVGVLFF